MFKVCEQQWSPSVLPPAALAREQAVVFGFKSRMLSWDSEDAVTARLQLLYVIFMVLTLRRRWGPEHVQLGKDRPPLPLVLSRDVSESPSNKLPKSQEGVCVRVCTVVG